jgi:acetyltransferase
LIENSSKLSLAEISEPIKVSLKKVLPPTAALGNPVDIVGDALEDRYRSALNILTSAKDNFGIIVLLTPQRVTPVSKIAKTVASFKGKKLLIPLFIGGRAIIPAEKIFLNNGLVNFSDPAEMINTLSALAPDAPKRPEVKSVAAAPAADDGQRMMDFNKTRTLVKKYGLKISGDFVESKNMLKRRAGKIPFPWAMKIASLDAVHKTEAGGVRINIPDIASAKKAWDEMSAKLLSKKRTARIDGFVVQPMVKGMEVIIGMKRDPNFGPVIIFGLGGIFVEILKDVSMRLAPVDEKEALAMINEIKSSAVLKGARGGQPVDMTSLAKIIVAVAKLAVKEKSIAEIDLNPVMATAEGVEIVDARIVVNDNPHK